jgi:hypothetical protein
MNLASNKMKHVIFGLNNAKAKCWRSHVKKLTFKFLAQNMSTYESWWFLLKPLRDRWDANVLTGQWPGEMQSARLN